MISPQSADDPGLPLLADGGQLLADEVRAELAAAGLPVLPPAHLLAADQSASGATVHLDEGVWVGWQIRGPLSEASVRALQVGAFRLDGSEIHPAIRYSGAVEEAFSEALAAILRALGYGVRADVNEYNPYGLLVSARPAGPHWRDPAVPPLAGSAGYSPGVRVRLIAGEFAGSVTTVVTAMHHLPLQGPPLSYTVEHPSGSGELEVAPGDLTLAP